MTDCTVSSGSSDAYTAFTHAEPSGIYPIPPSNIADAAVGHTQENSCYTYMCCGLDWNDLYLFIEHLQQSHVVVVEPSGRHTPAPPPHSFDHQSPPHISGPPSPSFTFLEDVDPLSPSSSSSTVSSHGSPDAFGAENVATSLHPIAAGLQRYEVDASCATAAPCFSERENATDFPATDFPVPGVDAGAVWSTQNHASDRALSTPSELSKAARTNTRASRQTSPFLRNKPFRCPRSGCSKSYKQANGLKYHVTHGSCSFHPSKDLEAVRELLCEKGLPTDGDLSESEAHAVELEADRRLRPYACAVGECGRRYKNLNGLRYHYQHSGEHGAEGLRLLNSGEHPSPARRAAQDGSV